MPSPGAGIKAWADACDATAKKKRAENGHAACDWRRVMEKASRRWRQG